MKNVWSADRWGKNIMKVEVFYQNSDIRGAKSVTSVLYIRKFWTNNYIVADV